MSSVTNQYYNPLTPSEIPKEYVTQPEVIRKIADDFFDERLFEYPIAACPFGSFLVDIKIFLIDPIIQIFRRIFCCRNDDDIDFEALLSTASSFQQIKQEELDALSVKTKPDQLIDALKDRKFDGKSPQIEQFLSFLKSHSTLDFLFNVDIKQSGSKGNALKALQSHLFYLVNQCRNLQELDKDDIETLLTLIKLLNIQGSDLPAFCDSFVNKFTFNPKLKNEVSLEIIMMQALPKILTPYTGQRLAPLGNLGATCYLNSVLKLIASCHEFDSFINAPQSDSLRESLRGYLILILNKIRNNESISHQEYSNFYLLLQMNGWDSDSSMQQDPHEFLRRFLFNIAIPIPAACLHLQIESSKRCTVEGGDIEERSEISYNSEIACSIPLIDNSLSKSIQSFQDLVEDVFNESEVKEMQWDHAIETPKSAQYLKEVPQTLFIQLKRFTYCKEAGKAKKINIDLPICTPEAPNGKISLPVYDNIVSDRFIKEVVPYQIKSVICHLGTSLTFGHYITVVKEADGWVKYDDRTTTKLSEMDALKLINSSGYYFCLEKI